MVTASTSLIDAARSVLLEPDPFEKQKLTDEIARIWREGRMEVGEDVRDSPLVDTPARSGLVQTLEPSKMPKMGKGGSLSSRQVPPPAAQCICQLVLLAACAEILVWMIQNLNLAFYLCR